MPANQICNCADGCDASVDSDQYYHPVATTPKVSMDMDALDCQKPKYLYHKNSIQKLLGWLLIAFYIMLFNNNALSESVHHECITKYRQQLIKGGFSGGLFCRNGSTFNKINIKNRNYIVYNYVYVFRPEGALVFHGGQRILFFNPRYEYLGQFFVSTPPSSVVLPKKDKLILMVDQKSICEILLSSPPKAASCEDDLEFFR